MINRKGILFFIVILFASNFYLSAKKLADLPRLTKFFHITVGDKCIYISDGKAYTVRVYSRKDYKYIKSFGRHGEGPGEFVNFPSTIYIKGNELVMSNNREMHFTLEGKLIRERTIPLRYAKPVLNNYVGIEFENKRKLTRFGHPHMLINTYTNKFEKIKTIYKIIMKNVIMKRINEFECFSCRQDYDVVDDKIIISDPTKGFYFKVFDSTGTKFYEINIPYKKIKVTNDIKNKELKAIKKEFGKHWKSLKQSNKFIWPDYIPAYMQVRVFNDKICAFTFNTKGDNIELIIIDLKGKILGKTFVPRASQYMCTFKDGIYYYINEGEEVWELHSLKVF